MASDAQKIKLFERIRVQSRFAPVSADLRDEVTQEAWLLALDYATRRGKSLDALSATEIKFRILEASRKIRPRDIPTDFLANDIESVTDPDVEILGIETADTAQKQVSDIEYILTHHPKIKLSPRQRDIYEELKNCTPGSKYRWKASYARATGVSRQNIYNIEKKVQEKTRLANDFSSFLQGNVTGFFNKYSIRWPTNSILRDTIIYPLRSMPETNPVATRLRTMGKQINDTLFSILEKPSATGKETAEKTAQIDYLLDIIALINPKEFSGATFNERLFKKQNPLLDIFVSNSLNYRLLLGDDDALLEYNERIKFYIEHLGSEGDRIASYTMCVYGVTDNISQNNYLISGGIYTTPVKDIAPLISRTYVNMREKFYAQSAAALDYNFLRMLLVLKRSSLATLNSNSRNALRVLAQKATYSRDGSIVQSSHALLNTLRA